MAAQTQQTQAAPQTQAVAKPKITTQVLHQVEKMRQRGTLLVPPDYSPEMALNSAWIALQETKDKNNHPVLDVCKDTSIARALMDMVYMGLNPAKNQCYFIAYGDQLTCRDSYMGKIARAKRADSFILDIVAQIVYNDDEIETEVINGQDVVTRHVKHPFKPHSVSDIIGAYCNIIYVDGRIVSTIMTIDEVHRCWNVGNAQRSSKAHKETPEEMIKRTVIGRATKPIINTSNDANLLSRHAMESAAQARDEVIHARTNVVDVDFDTVSPEPPEQLPEEPKTPKLVEAEIVTETPATIPVAVNYETGEVMEAQPATREAHPGDMGMQLRWHEPEREVLPPHEEIMAPTRVDASAEPDFSEVPF